MKNIKLNSQVFRDVKKVNLPTDTGARGQFVDETDIPIQAKKTVSDPITANGEHTFNKDSQYDGMASITINVNVPTGGDVEGNHTETKDVVNGTAFEVRPLTGYSSMQMATITPNVATEEKTVTPKTTSQDVKPSTGRLLSKVTVKAVDKTIDSNIKAEYIKKDIQILGETGTYEATGGWESSKWIPIVENNPTEVKIQNPVDDANIYIDNETPCMVLFKMECKTNAPTQGTYTFVACNGFWPGYSDTERQFFVMSYVQRVSTLATTNLSNYKFMFNSTVVAGAGSVSTTTFNTSTTFQCQWDSDHQKRWVRITSDAYYVPVGANLYYAILPIDLTTLKYIQQPAEQEVTDDAESNS